ncbi:MAG TPA: hypothetical protein VNK95_05635 [Caldilineaceae bacterium]|nr:hypothetical protein [Caldilineaceae bacterium]
MQVNRRAIHRFRQVARLASAPVGFRARPLLLAGLLILAALPGLWLAAPHTAAGPLADVSPSAQRSQMVELQTYVPMLGSALCNGPKTSSVFGVQMYTDTGRSSPYFAALQASGASWVRVNLAWSQVEPFNVSSALFDWTTTDRALRGAAQACVNIVAVIDSSPWWAAPTAHAPLFPEAYDDFAAFVVALVERYDGDGWLDAPGAIVIRHWEFYNEPDIGPQPGGSGWGEHGAQYAEMLKWVYPAVKNADAGAQVLFGGISYDWFTEDGGVFIRTFLDDVLKAGGGDYFDIMNFHYYPSNRRAWTQSNSNGLVEKTAAVRAKLAEYGLDKPIAITEAGWHNNTGTVFDTSDEIQSRYVVQLFTQAMALDVEVMIWWMLYDPTSYPFATGLVTASDPPSVKPAYGVFQGAASRLQDAEFKATLTITETKHPDVEAYRFYDPSLDHTFYVAWLNPVNTVQARPLQVAGETAHLYGLDNVLSAFVRDADDGSTDGQVTVQVGGSPIYIVINQTSPESGDGDAALE